MFNTVGPDYFRTLRIPARRPVASSRTATTRPRRRSRSSTPRSPSGSGAARPTPSASGSGSTTASGARWSAWPPTSSTRGSTRRRGPYVYLPFFQSYRSGMMLHTRGPGARRDARRPGAGPGRGARRRHADFVGPAVHPEHQGRADLLRVGGGDAVRVRRRRHGAGRPGHLRPGVAHREAEHPRDRHPHGARRLGAVGAARLPRPGPPARARSAPGSASSPRSASAGCSTARCSASARPTRCRSRARWPSCWPA